MILETVTSYIFDKLFICQISATLMTFSLIKIGLLLRTRKRRFKLFKYYGIPGPEPSIVDGNLHEYKAVNASYKVDQAHYDKYGNYYGVFIGDEPSLIISDIEILREIFFDRISSFKERAKLFIETPLMHSILFARYQRWKTMRKIMSQPFSSFVMRGDTQTQFIEDSIKLMLHYIEEKIRCSISAVDQGASDLIDMHDLMKATALHMISSMAIRLPKVEVKENESNVKSLDSYLSSVDKGIITFAIKVPLIKPILSFLATHFEHNATMSLIHRGLNHTIDRELQRLTNNERNLTGEKKTLIHTLIKLHHEGKMTRAELQGNAEAILFAGYDTTSTTLAYIFWCLGKYTNVQERLRSELMAHGLESKYLDQVINETMRLYPTVISFTTRLATETVEVKGLTVPQGTTVIYNSWLMSRNPELWVEPVKFDPERFREGVEIHPAAFAPFGLGERKCLGYNLAKLEMKMITCDILMRYRLKTNAPESLELVSYANVLTKPKDKIMMELQKI